MSARVDCPSIMQRAPELRAFCADGLRWTAALPFADVLREEVLPRLQVLVRGEEAERVKHNRQRSVVSFRTSAGGVFMKCHHLQRLDRRLYQSLDASRARNEWRNALHLARLGVAVAEPLAFGEERSGGLLLRSYYLCRELEDAMGLRAYLLENGADRRKSMLQRLGRDVGAMHASGLIYYDLHAANVLVPLQDDRPHFLDLQSARRFPWALRTMRMGDLGRLLWSLEGCLREGDAEALLGAYLEVFQGERRELGAFLREARARGARIRAIHLKSRTRACLMNSTRFARDGGWTKRLFFVRGLERGALESCLHPHAQGVLVKSSRRTIVWRRELSGDQVAVKIFAPEGAKSILRFLFGRSRAERAWIASQGLSVRGIDTAEALACRARLFGPDALATRWLDDVVPLDRFVTESWQRLPPAQRARLAASLGRFVASLHRAHARIDDLSPKNVLVRAGDPPRFYLVDLEAVHLSRRLGDGWIVRNLSQLADLPPGPIDHASRRRFLAAYRHASDRPIHELLGSIETRMRERIERRLARARERGPGQELPSYYQADLYADVSKERS